MKWLTLSLLRSLTKFCTSAVDLEGQINVSNLIKKNRTWQEDCLQGGQENWWEKIPQDSARPQMQNQTGLHFWSDKGSCSRCKKEMKNKFFLILKVNKPVESSAATHTVPLAIPTSKEIIWKILGKEKFKKKTEFAHQNIVATWKMTPKPNLPAKNS